MTRATRILIVAALAQAAAAAAILTIVVTDRRELRALREDVDRVRAQVQRQPAETAGTGPPASPAVPAVPQSYLDEVASAAGEDAATAKRELDAKSAEWRRWAEAQSLTASEVDRLVVIMTRHEFRVQQAKYLRRGVDTDAYRDSYVAVESMLGARVALLLASRDSRFAR